MEIWVNPNCSKCRSAVSILDELGAEYTVRYYLENPPTARELREVLSRLGLEPWEITRTGDAAALDLDIKDLPRDPEHRERWIALLARHPRLIQRPIITADDGTTRVARTEDAVRSLVESAE